ncbi:MAG TPA: hypothetical protein VIL74_08915 [Pyrinomonadaceae bacterium]|jgi:hypothetical protein
MPDKKRKRKNAQTEPQALIVVPQTARTSTGRKCTICAHVSVARINSMIAKGESFRNIAKHFLVHYSNVFRHARKCLALDVRAVMEERRISQAVDHFEELLKQLEFAKELQSAAREVLTVEEIGRVSLMPRALDIDVIYDDLTDIEPLTGQPQRKIRNLQSIINKLSEAPEMRDLHSVVKFSDLKDYALRTIAAVDTLLDKFARVEGRYQKDGAGAGNETEELKKLRTIIETRAQQENIPFGEMLVIFKDNYAHLYKPEIVEKLISEANN